MSACEACWDEAYRRSCLVGGSQVDHYQRLIETLDGHPTTREADMTDDEGAR